MHVDSGALVDEPLQHRAAEQLPPPGWGDRPMMRSLTRWERAKSRSASAGSSDFEADHLRAELARHLDVVEQVPLASESMRSGASRGVST